MSAFGFGGSNFHCVLEEAESAKTEAEWGDGEVQIVALSSASDAGLLEALDDWPRGLTWDAVRVRAAETRRSFRSEDSCRLLVVIEREGKDFEALRPGPRCGQDGAEPQGGGDLLRPRVCAGGLAVLFPGQGSQYVGMFRELACRFPSVFNALAEAEAEIPAEGEPRLVDLIYPLPVYDSEGKTRQDAALRATEAAQPALGAVERGIWRLLEEFGVAADAFAGHSFGELSALHAAGRIDAAGLDRLARTRGRLMAEQSRGGGGSMLAVRAPLETVESVLADERLDLVLANRNAPDQGVVSGPSAEIERAARAFQQRGDRQPEARRICGVS